MTVLCIDDSLQHAMCLSGCLYEVQNTKKDIFKFAEGVMLTGEVDKTLKKYNASIIKDLDDYFMDDFTLVKNQLKVFDENGNVKEIIYFDKLVCESELY